jgi:hypothetical protein
MANRGLTSKPTQDVPAMAERGVKKDHRHQAKFERCAHYKRKRKQGNHEQRKSAYAEPTSSHRR